MCHRGILRLASEELPFIISPMIESGDFHICNNIKNFVIKSSVLVENSSTACVDRKN